MFQMSRRIILAAFAAIVVASTSPSLAADKLKVVATFSILGDIARNVAGENISLTTLVGPNGDAHVYEPTPADARALAEADLVLVNGLGFEGWIDRLIKNSEYKGPLVLTTKGISPLGTKDDHGPRMLAVQG